mmetsp:Transcript_33606/g.79246  ORF Transcript_33606/g.79246 Transcript_33606/m.79246 type:complete len:317 (-) Transcript_33606:249-1199(-)
MTRISSVIKLSVLFSVVSSSTAFVAPIVNSFTVRQNHDLDLHRHQTTRPVFGIGDTTDDRLVDIRKALDRMNKLLRDDAGSSASIQTFQTRIRKVVKCGESSIPGAGRGLFATQNIKKGTVIGFYPVHGIGAEFEDGSSICCGTSPEDQKYFDELAKSDYLLHLFGSRRLGSADFGEDTQLFIDVNPSRTDLSECWNGHLVNDGATVAENSERGMLDYYTASQRTKNCVHIPFGPSPLLALVTTKKVKKGAELFTTYGCLYWLETIIKPGEEVADATEAVQLQARETAQDLFNAMRSAQTTYASQQVEIEDTFALM